MKRRNKKIIWVLLFVAGCIISLYMYNFRMEGGYRSWPMLQSAISIFVGEWLTMLIPAFGIANTCNIQKILKKLMR